MNAVGWQWNQLQAILAYSVPLELAVHMPAGYENRLIVGKPRYPLGLELEELPHSSRVQATTSPGVVKGQTGRAELAAAGLEPGRGITLSPTHAGAVVG